MPQGDPPATDLGLVKRAWAARCWAGPATFVLVARARADSNRPQSVMVPRMDFVLIPGMWLPGSVWTR